MTPRPRQRRRGFRPQVAIRAPAGVVRAGVVRLGVVRAAVGLALVLLAACGLTESPPLDAVARLGGGWVTLESFERYLQRTAGEDADELSSAVLSKLLDRFLEEELLARLAVDHGLVEPGVPRRRAVDRLLREQPAPEPGREEIERYYRDHDEEFERPERVRLRQILFDEPEAVERALAELEEGAEFDEVARRYSRDSTGETGGVQGELAREDLPPLFADTIFALEPGEVSDVVEAEYGFHLFQVMERLPAELLALEVVEDEIRRRLKERAADRHLDHLVEEARNRYPVAVQTRNLPFDYQGSFDEMS